MLHSKLAISLRNNGTLDALKVCLLRCAISFLSSHALFYFDCSIHFQYEIWRIRFMFSRNFEQKFWATSALAELSRSNVREHCLKKRLFISWWVCQIEYLVHFLRLGRTHCDWNLLVAIVGLNSDFLSVTLCDRPSQDRWIQMCIVRLHSREWIAALVDGRILGWNSICITSGNAGNQTGYCFHNIVGALLKNKCYGWYRIPV